MGTSKTQEVATLMVSNPKNTPNHNGKDDHSSDFKAFVEGTAAEEHPDRKHEKATGTNKYMDKQNNMIDQHNLRK
jgi:hypothetical protein